MHLEARRLRALGFAIHWLKPKTKMPIKSGWTSGPRESMESLRASYKKGFNMGVRLGAASKIDNGFLAVIDCDVKSKDPKHLKELKQKLKSLTQGHAPIVISGRGNGSKHIYIRTPEPLKPFRYAKSEDLVTVFMPSVEPSTKEKKALTPEQLKKGLRLRAAWEISVMGEGQQVVLPPSIHPDSGKPYEWGSPILKAEDIPLIDIKPPAGSEGKKELKALEDFKVVPVDLYMSSLDDSIVELIVNGKDCEDRSAAMFTAAIAMRRAGFSEAQILTVLTDKENFLGATGFDHAKTNSRKRAAEWVYKYTYQKAKKEADFEDEFNEGIIEEALSEEAAKLQEAEIVGERDWRARIERNQTDGRPRSSFHNIKLILENVLAPGFLKHNEFTLEDHWLVNTPWGSKVGEQVKDIDVLNIKDFLVAKYRLEAPKEKIIEVIRVIGNKNSFHPIRDYLTSLVWDGTPRLNTWLSRYLGATGPGDYLAVVGRKTLTAMVARIFEPGIAFHHVLILEGKTRHGKSETCRILASKEYHLDNELDLNNKDSRQGLLGKWIVELGELAVVHRFGVNAVKNFISNDVDSFRRPYGMAVEHFKRQCVFIGTTNNERYLKDLTGNARYWPVVIEKLQYDDLIKDRDQLFAEAVLNYQLGESVNHHTKEFYKLAEKIQDSKMEGEDILSLVSEAVEGKDSLFANAPFRTIDIVREVGTIPGHRSGRALEMQVSNSLRELGFHKEQKMVNGVKGRWWVR